MTVLRNDEELLLHVESELQQLAATLRKAAEQAVDLYTIDPDGEMMAMSIRAALLTYEAETVERLAKIIVEEYIGGNNANS